MKLRLFKNRLALVGTLLAFIFYSGCSLLDPSEVVNPNTTQDDLEAGAAGATAPFLAGVQRNFTLAVEDGATIHDTVSDNYDNISTYLTDVLDTPDMFLPRDATGYNEHQTLRATAEYLLTVVAPNDPDATDDQWAEAYFYRGMANLFSAECYWAVPPDEDMEPLTMQARLDLALADFNEALTYNADADFAAKVHLVKARLYRIKGDKTNAITEADMAIANGGSNYVFFAEFDASTTTNDLFFFALARSLHDLQPLPRLEFLEPKYLSRDQGIAVAKMEEAYLIKAEAYLAAGDYDNAKDALAEAITIAKARPTDSVVDDDPRTRTDGNFIPQDENVLVKASPSSPAIAGLIIPRNGAMVEVPTISGTSLDADAVRAMPSATTEDKVELLRLVYLARQEIFFGEGRRMCDLGIRLPMSEREMEQNTSVEIVNGLGTGIGGIVYVPSFIPVRDGMDDYTVSNDETTITIDYDMNYLLAINRNSFFRPNANDLSTTMPFAPYAF